MRENQVGISLENGEWIIYVTDERASKVLGSIINFKSEDEALEVLIRKARLDYLLMEIGPVVECINAKKPVTF